MFSPVFSFYFPKEAIFLEIARTLSEVQFPASALYQILIDFLRNSFREIAEKSKWPYFTIIDHFLVLYFGRSVVIFHGN